MTQSAELLHMETGTLLKQEQGRAVFAVKAPDDLVVKVPMKALRAADTGRVRPFLYKHFPTTRHRMLLRQLTHDIEVRIRSHDAGIASPIAFTNGVMRTDMGLGLLMQRVGPEGGGLGMTLDEFVARDLLDTAALKALNDFSRAVFALGVVAPALNSRSIVWGQREGKWQPLIAAGCPICGTAPCTAGWSGRPAMSGCIGRGAKRCFCAAITTRSTRVTLSAYSAGSWE